MHFRDLPRMVQANSNLLRLNLKGALNLLSWERNFSQGISMRSWDNLLSWVCIWFFHRGIHVFSLKTRQTTLLWKSISIYNVLLEMSRTLSSGSVGVKLLMALGAWHFVEILLSESTRISKIWLLRSICHSRIASLEKITSCTTRITRMKSWMECRGNNCIWSDLDPKEVASLVAIALRYNIDWRALLVHVSCS
jgi:hypothetical protein